MAREHRELLRWHRWKEAAERMKAATTTVN